MTGARGCASFGIACLASFAVTVAGAAAVVHENDKLVASDATSNDELGNSVAIAGGTILAGAPGDDTGFPGAGAAYVFFDDGFGWSEEAKLVADDPSMDAQFGTSVSLSGNSALVGGWRADNAGGNDAGAAYVFVRQGTDWSHQATLTASDATSGMRLGAAVAIDGETALVGATSGIDDGLVTGAAYIFVRDGTSWTEQAKLDPSGLVSGAQFGTSVALFGDTAVVGSLLDDLGSVARTGSVFVFVREGGVWTEQAKLTAGDAAEGDRFGASVAVWGDTIVIGATHDDDNGSFSGAAYVFVRADAVWTEQAKLTASDASEGDRFGGSAAVEGDIAVVGSVFNALAFPGQGSAYQFARSRGVWSEQAILAASDAAPSDSFAVGLAIANARVAVGSEGSDHGGVLQAGAVYVFSDFDADGVPALSAPAALVAVLLLLSLSTIAVLRRTAP